MSPLAMSSRPRMGLAALLALLLVQTTSATAGAVAPTPEPQTWHECGSISTLFGETSADEVWSYSVRVRGLAEGQRATVSYDLEIVRVNAAGDGYEPLQHSTGALDVTGDSSGEAEATWTTPARWFAIGWDVNLKTADGTVCPVYQASVGLGPIMPPTDVANDAPVDPTQHVPASMALLMLVAAGAFVAGTRIFAGSRADR